MSDNILFTQEEIEEMQPVDLINRINVLWDIQHEKAIEAEILMIECEKLEEQMIKMIKRVSEIDPEGYEEYLKTFGKEEDNENLDSQ